MNTFTENELYEMLIKITNNKKQKYITFVLYMRIFEYILLQCDNYEYQNGNKILWNILKGHGYCDHNLAYPVSQYFYMCIICYIIHNVYSSIYITASSIYVYNFRNCNHVYLLITIYIHASM
jgi:hypothetical protein